MQITTGIYRDSTALNQQINGIYTAYIITCIYRHRQDWVYKQLDSASNENIIGMPVILWLNITSEHDIAT